MARLSSVRDFEKAGKLKETLAFCRSFCARQRFIQRFRQATLTVREEGEDGLEYRFQSGRLVRIVPSDGQIREWLVPDELRQLQTDPRFVLDRANLVYSWLMRTKTTCRYEFEDDPQPESAVELGATHTS
jgi:hypothetical protein